jgi:hypothetical protein
MIRNANSTAIERAAAPRVGGVLARTRIIWEPQKNPKLAGWHAAKEEGRALPAPRRRGRRLAVLVYDDGKVHELGTAAKGQPYARWSFKLSSYEEDAAV